MDHRGIALRLAGTPGALRALLTSLPAPDATRRPPGGAWSINEIVGHLLDEERDDFPPRLRSLLSDPGAKWPRLDPEASARERRHSERPLAELLAAFEAERARSVAWLNGLGSPDWSLVYEHSPPGPITAGQLLACWAAHDALHVRQVAKRLFELAQRDAEGASLAYAGEWRA